MSRASNLTKLIERFLQSPLNEGDMDGDVVVEGRDWDSTCAKFRKAVEQAGLNDHDDRAFEEAVWYCVARSDILQELDPVSCILSMRTAKRGKTKYYDYLVRANFDLPKDSPSPEDMERIEYDVVQEIQRDVRPELTWVRDFGFNIKRKKKEGLLSCKFVFKLEKLL